MSLELELATVYDIAEELSKRGMQFIIAIEKTKIRNGKTAELEICVDKNKNMREVAETLAPFFGIELSGECDCGDGNS
jgi:hypothetical protein